MFEAHKLITASQFNLKILLKADLIALDELDFLLRPKLVTQAPSMNSEVSGWLSEAAWYA